MARTAACALPATVVGMTDASTTRRPDTPTTRSHGSATASAGAVRYPGSIRAGRIGSAEPSVTRPRLAGSLAALVREIKLDDRRLLGGRVENALTENPYSTASEQISQFVYEYNRTGRAREPFFTTNNFALAAHLFRAVGGFATSIPSATAEDKEFCDRWRAHGLALAHVPTAVVHHAHNLTFARFLRQHFDYGRGILAFRLIRRRRATSRFVPEPLKFYTGLMLSPMRRPSSVGRWRLVALLVAAQVATLLGALREALTWPPFTCARVTSRRLDRQ